MFHLSQNFGDSKKMCNEIWIILISIFNSWNQFIWTEGEEQIIFSKSQLKNFQNYSF